MNSIAGIDTLMAALYPHIHQYRAGGLINAPPSLQPRERNTAIHDLVDSFAALFGLYPQCETVAVAVQTPLRRPTSLYVCPSSPTPDEFNVNVKNCVAQFMSTCAASNGQAHGEGELSQSEQHFIVDTYSLCYAVMRQRAIIEEHLWNSLVKPRPPKFDKEQRSRENVAGKLAQLSKLLENFLETISHHEADLGDDTLRFHKLCLEIRDKMKDKELEDYIDEYLYLQGVDCLLAYYFCLPIAISKLLSLSPSLELPFDDERPTIVVKPSQGARQFKAILVVEHLRERFGLGDNIDWEDVEHAFVDEKDFGIGLNWNAEERVLSTGGPVTPHPEVTLIHELLNKGDSDQKLNVYIACSTAPCYASVMYAGAVNDVLKEQKRRLRFTMRTDDPDWCRLSAAEPWILPEGTRMEVVERLKDELLSELGCMIDAWARDKLDEGKY